MSTPAQRIIGTRRIDGRPDEDRRHLRQPARGSSNTAVLHAAARLAPAGVEVILFEGIADLPFFNPDLDGDDVPAPVGAMRALIGSVDGLLISSPEYARGVAGVLKNALDWLVGSHEFPDKPRRADQHVAARNACAGRADIDAGNDVGPARYGGLRDAAAARRRLGRAQHHRRSSHWRSRCVWRWSASRRSSAQCRLMRRAKSNCPPCNCAMAPPRPRILERAHLPHRFIMPHTSALLGFALVCLGIVLTPGPNMIYLISRSITQGPAAGHRLARRRRARLRVLHAVRGVRHHRAAARRALCL